MKIELEHKTETPTAKKGDIIQFEDEVIGIVLADFEIAILKYPDGDDCFVLANTKKADFTAGKYKILARADEWKITRI